jgi:hypothetical protein
MKKNFKSDIRSVFGQVDAQDSEMEDAGGLNNEGLQLTVRDDAIASWHQSLKDGPLAKLMRVMGWTDWQISFVPPEKPDDPPAQTEVVQAAATAEQAGIPYAIEDGQFRVVDSEGEREPEGAPDAEPGGQPADDSAPGGGGFGQSETTSVDVGLEKEAAARAAKVLSQDDAVSGARWLGQAYDEMFAPPDDDTHEQQAVTLEQQDRLRDPEFSRDDDVPQFAQELLDDAITGGAVEQPEDLSDSEHRQLEAVLRNQLVEQGNWTINQIRTDIQKAVNVESDTARVYAVNGVQNVVQAAIQLGYMVGGDLDERRFYLGGPDHPNICEACEQLLAETNPHRGGDPMQLDELIDTFEDVAESHGIESQYVNGGSIHPNCLHRLVEHREARP